MPVSWIFALVCMGCSEPSEHILRGQKHDAAIYNEVAVDRTGTTASVVRPQPAQNEQESEAVEMVNAKQRRPLNLTLPKELLEDTSAEQLVSPFPNLFRDEDASGRMSLSGTLYWDETEQAEEVPILESINGAGLEIIILTP